MTKRSRIPWIALCAGVASVLVAAAACTSSNVTIHPLPRNLLVADNEQGELLGVIDFFNKNDQGAIPPLYSLTNAGLLEIHSVARDSSGNVFVGGNNDGTPCFGSIFVFPSFSNGVTNPTRTITGPLNTTLDDSIQGITVDGSGNVYVTQDNASTDTCPPVPARLKPRVAVFGPTATGDVAPSKTVFAPNPFSQDDLLGIALDGSGNVWVAEDHDNGTGNVYQLPNVAGTPAPTLTLTGIAEPWGVAVDATNNVYVVDQDTSNLFPATTPAVLVYDAGTTTPNAAKTITGPLTKLCAPHDVKVDATNIYVSNGETNGTGSGVENCFDPNFIGVLVWNVGDSGNVAPRRVLAGLATTMHTPVELSF